MPKVIMSKTTQKKKPAKATANQINLQMISFLLAILAMLVYANTLGYQFALDDFSVIKDNYIVKKGITGIGTILTTDYRYGYWTSGGTLYRPVSLIMFAIEWAISPDNPFLGHLVNILLFGATIIVLFHLLNQYIINGKPWLAAAICLLFAVHPIHSEVVANIKSRDEILGLLACLLALKYYLKSLKTQSSYNLIISCLWFVLAMFSKESAIIFLAIFPLTAYFFFDSPVSKSLKSAALLLLPAIFYLLIRQSVIGNHLSLDKTSILDNFIVGTNDPITRFSSAIMMLGYYLKSFCFPIILSHEMGFNQISLASISDWRFLLSAIIHIAMVVYIVKYFKKKDLIAYGLSFYLISISIVSNLIITIGTSYGERLFYVPSLGLIIAFCAILYKFQENIPSASFNNLKPSFKWPIIALAVLFSLKTIARNNAWHDSYTLYKTDIKYAPNSAKMRYHYALELGKKANDEKDAFKQKDWRLKAIQQDSISLAIYPKNNDPLAHKGLMYYHLKDFNKAIENYKKAIALGDLDPKTFSNMGTLYSEMGHNDLAMENYKKAVELDPRFVDARRNLGCLMAIGGNFTEAISQFQEALKYDPNNPNLLFFMGSAYRDSGNTIKGKELLDQAYALKPELEKK